MTPQYEIVLTDVFQGMANWRMWGRLGWQETKRRYRRTSIGPFWTTISLGVFIFTLGFLWANLWKQDPKTYLSFLTSGMIAWALIQTIISEGCQTFISAQGMIKSFPFHYTTLSCAVVWRNVIVLFHNFAIYLLVALYANVPVTWNSLLIIPGLLLIAINGIWVSTLLGLACARFRDIQQIVATLLQVSIFVTPIFWAPEQLGPRLSALVDMNFLFHYVEILRAPLLGRAPSTWSWGMAIGGTVFGWCLTAFFFSRFRRRLPYWL